jgi:acetolactate synthase-1/2/3 large subunit
VILDNQCYGMIRQFQQSYFDGRYQSSLWGYSAPDFVRIGEAYGVASRRLERPDDIVNALTWLWETPLSSALLRVSIDVFANAYPKIAFGRPITEMEPFASSVDVEGT